MESNQLAGGLKLDFIERLTHMPVQVQCEWVAKLSATRPPDYLPRSSYTLHCRLSAAVPFLLVWLLGNERRLDYARGLLDDAAYTFEVALLQLEDWENEQPVQLGFGGAGVGIDGPAELQTGVVYDWAVDPAPSALVHKALLVAREDVENVRGRWRLKPALWVELPSYLAFLQHGRRLGSMRLDR